MYTRNKEIEDRIKKHDEYRKKVGNTWSPYSGMAMDGLSEGEKQLLYEEIRYMKQHPELYKK